MTPIEALQAAVLDAPADDVARLVLADALDETGDAAAAARAEFIRLQVAGVDDGRQQELLAHWLRTWLPRRWTAHDPVRLGWWRLAPYLEVAFARGFVAGVRLLPPTIAWPEPGYAPALTANLLTDCVAHLFADQPLESVFIALGPLEEWRVVRADGWRFVNAELHAGELPNPTRQDFAAALHARLRYRLLRLGQLGGPVPLWRLDTLTAVPDVPAAGDQPRGQREQAGGVGEGERVR